MMASQGDIYLDHNATTPLWPSVVERISEALVDAWGNPSSAYGSGVCVCVCVCVCVSATDLTHIVTACTHTHTPLPHFLPRSR